MKTLRVRTVPTQRTDLLCIACGRFTMTPTSARKRHHAIVVDGETSDEHASAGVHHDCIDRVRAKVVRASKPQPPVRDDDDSEPDDPLALALDAHDDAVEASRELREWDR